MIALNQESQLLIWSGPIGAVVGLSVGIVSNIRAGRARRQTAKVAASKQEPEGE